MQRPRDFEQRETPNVVGRSIYTSTDEVLPMNKYQKGKRLEVRVRAWLRSLDPDCARSMLSRGADLTFLWLLRVWTVSCKSGKHGTGAVAMNKIKAELEDHDLCITHEDRDAFPMVHIYLPKFVEILGRSETESAAMDRS